MISDVDFPEIKEVDLKLIELARTLEGKIVTNDFNLNKVAQLRGVAVLNINELANSLKPVVLPGELMKVFILKEGKEYNQGVAYLGRRHDGRRGQRAEDDRQDDRRGRHERAADDGRQDDLRTLHRSRDGGAGRTVNVGRTERPTGGRARSPRAAADASLRCDRWQMTAAVMQIAKFKMQTMRV
jgi:hypothetical protein